MSFNLDAESFGKRVQLLRLHESLTQKEFASKLGITQGMLSYYEAGKSKPTIEMIEKIADLFDVSLDWLCGRSIYKDVHPSSMSDLFSGVFALFETEEFHIITDEHLVDLEKDDEIDDDNRCYVTMKIYHNDNRHCHLGEYNGHLCQAIMKADRMNRELRDYQRNQESYEKDKAKFLDYFKNGKATKLDHSNISEEERIEKMIEIMENKRN